MPVLSHYLASKGMRDLNLARIWHTKNPLFPGGFCNISILGGSHPSLISTLNCFLLLSSYFLLLIKSSAY